MSFIDEYTGKKYRSKEDYEKMIDEKERAFDHKVMLESVGESQ